MALAKLGYNDRVYTMNTQVDYPSYGYMLLLDATTFWESWDFSNDSSSHNHHMMGSVSQWLVQAVAGRPSYPLSLLPILLFHSLIYWMNGYRYWCRS
jgi:alpha-L-rhamnosidase